MTNKEILSIILKKVKKPNQDWYAKLRPYTKRKEKALSKKCDKLLSKFIDAPVIKIIDPFYFTDTPFYDVEEDIVCLPANKYLKTPAMYHFVKFHELAHSAISNKRLNITFKSNRTFISYIENHLEEATADLSACILSEKIGIFEEVLDWAVCELVNYANDYISNKYVSKIKRNKEIKKFIEEAFGYAEHVTNYILGESTT